MKKVIGKGIDVSRWQGNIDWRKVAAEGIGFVMVKATQGEGVKARDGKGFCDSTFMQNITGAHAAGLRCGAYHYACFTDKAKAAAENEYFFETLQPFKDKITLYAALDLEDAAFMDQKRKAQNTDLVLLFAEKAKAHGFIPALYTNNNFLTYYYEKERLEGIAIWKAHYYNSRKDEPIPVEPTNIVMWQWTEKGRVNGISTDVDLDLVFDVPEIKVNIDRQKLKDIALRLCDLVDEFAKLLD